MTTTTPATASPIVMPLQRNRVVNLPPREHQPEHRGRHAESRPSPDVHAFWDAEAQGLFTGPQIDCHGRRCGCSACKPSATAEVAS